MTILPPAFADRRPGSSAGVIRGEGTCRVPGSAGRRSSGRRSTARPSGRPSPGHGCGVPGRWSCRSCRSAAEGGTCRAGQRRTLPHLRRARRRQPEPRGRPRGGAPRHPRHPGFLARRIRQLSEEIQALEVRLTWLVERHAPQLLEVVGIGPDTAVTLLITIGDNPERLGSERRSRRCAGSVPSSFPRAVGSTVASTAAATGKPTRPCTGSCRLACASTRAPRTTTNIAARRARPGARQSEASSAMRPGRSSTWSGRYPPSPRYRGSRET
ncbi:hypothetical protein FHS34_005280 [Streptomyces echinatus]|uniref:Transposase n=1 Tax=Streptomyces echinatus TaxID=67293 RepID=A0A7W9USR3_9ACTN|nr:hypothetical protein [Streptomyces echinatus]